MWSSSDLLKYMSLNSYFFGVEWKHITSCDPDYALKKFTDCILTHLDLSAQARIPMIEFEYQGKGDIKCTKVSSDYSFSASDAEQIMNFLACKLDKRFIDPLSSFAIYRFLLFDDYIYTDYLNYLYRFYSKGER